MRNISFDRNTYTIVMDNGEEIRLTTDEIREINTFVKKAEQYMEIDFWLEQLYRYDHHLFPHEKDKIIDLFEKNHTTVVSDNVQWSEAVSAYMENRKTMFYDACKTAGLTDERYERLMEEYEYDLNNVAGVIDEWNIDQLNKGYTVYDFNRTGLLEIEKIDSLNVFESDREAAIQAQKDGVKIIPVEELPENFEEKRFGFIDTPENRAAINRFCLRDVIPEAYDDIIKDFAEYQFECQFEKADQDNTISVYSERYGVDVINPFIDASGRFPLKNMEAVVNEYGIDLINDFTKKSMEHEFTWDDLCEMAMDKGHGNTLLKAKDNARWEVEEFAKEKGLFNPEEAQIPEDMVDDYCNKFELKFNIGGSLLDRYWDLNINMEVAGAHYRSEDPKEYDRMDTADHEARFHEEGIRFNQIREVVADKDIITYAYMDNAVVNEDPIPENEMKGFMNGPERGMEPPVSR